MKNELSKQDYINYLIGLKGTVFKIIPLCQHKNEFFHDYLDSLLTFELYGIGFSIQDLPHDVWYQKTIAVIEAIYHQPLVFEDFKKVRKEILGLLRLIDKQINQLKGE